MNATNKTSGNSGRSVLVWYASIALVIPIAFLATSYVGGQEMADGLGRFVMVASMWLLFALGIIFALLGLAAFVFGKERNVPFLCLCVGGTVGFLLFSGMLWFMNYPLHTIEVDTRARGTQAATND